MVMVGFLLPIINKLMMDSNQVKRSPLVMDSNQMIKRSPFSLILVPTAELAIQVAII